MNLREYIDEVKDEQERMLTPCSDNVIITQLSEESNIGKTTIYKMLHGHKLNRYNLAVALSQATGGRVKIGELLKQG